MADAPRGGLASWQQRRVKELMSASLNDEIPLSRLANECGLSVRQFARAFRVSTGLPPHRWLLRHRVDRARELLRTRALSGRCSGILRVCRPEPLYSSLQGNRRH